MIDEIKCPHCGWQPDGKPHWLCQSCEYEFNMFADAGRCPRCGYQHEYTQCVSWEGGCEAIAPHLDWYAGLDRGLEEIDIKRTNH